MEVTGSPSSDIMKGKIDLELCLNVEQYQNQTPPSTAYETNMDLPMHHLHPPKHPLNPRVRRYDEFRADHGLETEHLHDLPNPQHPPMKKPRTSFASTPTCLCEHDPREPSDRSSFHPNFESAASATQSIPHESHSTAPDGVNKDIHTEGCDATRETHPSLPPIERLSALVVPTHTRPGVVRSLVAPATPFTCSKPIFAIYEDPQEPDHMDMDVQASYPNWTPNSPDDDKENAEEEEARALWREEGVSLGSDGRLSWEDEYHRLTARPFANTEYDTGVDGGDDEGYGFAGTEYDSVGVSS